MKEKPNNSTSTIAPLLLHFSTILFFRCGDDHQDPTDPCQHQDLLLHLRLQQHRSEIHLTHYDDEELELNVGNADGGDDGEGPVLFSPFVYSLHLGKTDISFDLLLIHSTCSLVGIDTNLFALGAPTSLCCTFLYGAFSFCFSLPPAPTMSTIYSLPR